MLASLTVGSVVPSTVASHDSFLALACIDLNGENLTATTIYLTSNSSDVVELCLSMKGSLEHCLEDFVLVSGGTLLQLAVVQEVHTKASKEVRVKAIYESLADAMGSTSWSMNG
jgi:hypothetical protein